MEKPNYKNLFIEAVKEGVEEYKPKEKKLHDYKDQIFNGEKRGRYKKVVAATQLLLNCFPEKVSEKIKTALDNQDYDKLPFDFEQYNFQEKIGKGAVTKVHLLQAKDETDPSYVVKIGYIQKGDVNKLQKIAQTQHEEYEKIKDTYKDIDGFILKEQSMITTDKKNGEPVIATIQEYAGNNMRDFFTEIKKDELIDLLRENDEFREEFLKFAEITLHLANNENLIIDFLGNKNLSVVEVNGSPHLRFIDPHNLSSTVSDDDKRIKDLQEAIDYIKEIKNIIEKQ